ncbi:leucine-rich repeat-containing protein 31-like [Patiria miniata]|uniref:Uncharacterized protein n=1 Tax=Patiria miniata TaxID=46514 RepID=A0A913ZR10_PATMI|nr:leucine-rich repeat-containing protein 31-like [Patiria miniata]
MRNLVNCDFGSFIEKWRVQSLGNGIALSIKEFSVTAKDLADVLQSFTNRRKLFRLSLDGIYGLDGSASIWTPLLQNLTELQELELRDCSLQIADIEHLAAALGQVPNLANLNLSKNGNLGGNAETWAASLQSMIHLKKLDMSNCSINSRDLKYIAESVSPMRNLVDCDFSSYPEVWRVQSLGNGIEMSIERFSLTAKDLADVLQSFTNRRKLFRLSLDGIYGLDGSASIWTPLLQNLTELQELEIRDCSLQIADIEHIAAALGQMPNLADLNLSRNEELGGNAKTWAASLRKMIHLNSLNLSKCAINEQDLPHIASSVGEMPNLTDLNLSRKWGLGGSAEIWTPPLQNMTELRELNLIRCSLQSTDIEHIAAAVSRMPTVESLSLVGNDSLRGFAQTWARCLNQMKHVSSLKLGGCALTKEDKKHISEAWGSGVDFESSEDD